MNKPKFAGKVIKGKFTLDDRPAFDQYVSTLKNGYYQISLDKFRKSRTTGQDWEKSNQNGYYWGVVIPHLVEYFAALAQKEGNPAIAMDGDQIHDGIKMLFMNEGTFAKFPKIKSTKNLDTLEWEGLMTAIREWAAEEYHIYIPEPKQG